MKTISLLHTVPSVYQTFAQRLRDAMPEETLTIHNTVDEYLASDANIRGFTGENLERLLLLLKAAEKTHPDVIVTTCSTLTPWVDQIRPLIDVPIIAIDDAMCALAAKQAQRITVYATAQSTVEPTVNKIKAEAKKQNTDPTIEILICHEGYRALQQADMPTHDRLVLSMADDIPPSDVVVLAQASMAHLAPRISELCGCSALSSPDLCVRQVKQMLNQKG